MQRKRILFNTEASYTLSGFGTYTKNVLNRLHATDKYDIAELASFGTINHPEAQNIPWKYYANAVDPSDPRHGQYKQHPSFSFGKWRFEQVLLDFQPDIVFDIRDYWMLSYEADSPLRRFFHHCIMPTVDSAPQQEEWIENFLQADGVFTYTDWAQKVLHQESGGKIKLCGTASPGVDLDIFRPHKNVEHIKKELGLPENSYIIGTVMRNQKRKLYPDLFIAFRKFLDLCVEHKREDIAKKTYLYCHSSYPDFGWNFPLLMKEQGISHKVIFTYMCQNCNKHFSTIFQDARTTCPFCRQPAATMPSVSRGLTYSEMANMMSCFDIYIQYAIAEGMGMSQPESAGLGIPIMAVDYSAMHDIVEKTHGIPLKVNHFFRELETGAYRAYPDTDYTAEQMYKFFTCSDEDRSKKGKQAYSAAKKYYNWDNTAKTWEKYFDNVELTGCQGKWKTTPPNIKQPAPLTPETNTLDNMAFVNWLITAVWHEPKYLNSFASMRMLRDLNYGAEMNGPHPSPLTRETLYNRFIERVKENNACEEIRCGLRQSVPADYIIFANRKK